MVLEGEICSVCGTQGGLLGGWTAKGMSAIYNHPASVMCGCDITILNVIIAAAAGVHIWNWQARYSLGAEIQRDLEPEQQKAVGSHIYVQIQCIISRCMKLPHTRTPGISPTRSSSD